MITKRVKPLVCGGLSFDPLINRAWGNKIDNRFVYFRRLAADRALMNLFMTNQERPFTYPELLDKINRSELKDRKIGSKFINDKIDALKKKLLKLDFSREELGNMFVCDGGYMLVRPKIGKRYARAVK